MTLRPFCSFLCCKSLIFLTSAPSGSSTYGSLLDHPCFLGFSLFSLLASSFSSSESSSSIIGPFDLLGASCSMYAGGCTLPNELPSGPKNPDSNIPPKGRAKNGSSNGSLPAKKIRQQTPLTPKGTKSSKTSKRVTKIKERVPATPSSLHFQENYSSPSN
uniref:Uncharacterized protein n=1 Tax=Rhizophora mucronata TaxID=61149 RepID=A0A2P2L0T1_RHIMU